MGTANGGLRFGVTIWRFEQEREKEKGEAISTTRTLLGRSGPAGRAGGRSQRICFTTLGFPAGVFPTFWELVFSRQLLSGVEKACRYVDRTGYQRTTSGCAQRCLRRRFGGFLYTRLLQVRLTRTGFPAGGFHSFRVGCFFVEGKVRLKEKD